MFFCCTSTLLQCLVFFTLLLFIYCNVVEAFCVLRLSCVPLRVVFCTRKWNYFPFFSMVHLHTSTRGVGRKEKLFCNVRVYCCRCKISRIDIYETVWPRTECLCSAWALSDDLKFQADERRCTYTSRVAVWCACTQFEVDWSDVRPRVDYVDEISLVQRGRVRPEPHIHKSIRIFIPLWPTMTTTTATTSAATVVKRWYFFGSCYSRPRVITTTTTLMRTSAHSLIQIDWVQDIQ